ncbi:histidine phosphatase family protein [Chitinophaga agrisoli]|uniref:Histidine phosphatase family protein n=1 Tax=Chitinophaga agrisoli TaxID=2607653 RepID=A0A5B2VK20_9BACT|nr:histidine phosphatase family protein [Chitinophaga agrisoli]KAA2239315.1 histidine phosphatase family protein [Chitinophaga agrisoli]
MLNVYLLRHGQTPYNADGTRYSGGYTDIPLTEKGIEQAHISREQLKHIQLDAVYSSPLIRAYRTAEIASNYQTVITDERLREANFGAWEGKRQEEFVPENEQLWADWNRDPGVTKAGGTGETALQIVARVNDFFESIRQKHNSGNILVAGHNGTNRFYLCHKLDMPLKHYRKIVQLNAAITMFTLDEEGGLTLQLLNSKL